MLVTYVWIKQELWIKYLKGESVLFIVKINFQSILDQSSTKYSIIETIMNKRKQEIIISVTNFLLLQFDIWSFCSHTNIKYVTAVIWLWCHQIDHKKALGTSLRKKTRLKTRLIGTTDWFEEALKVKKKIKYFFRFYLELRKDPHGPDVALFIGNLPANLSHKQYETILLEFLDESKHAKQRSVFL